VQPLVQRERLTARRVAPTVRHEKRPARLCRGPGRRPPPIRVGGEVRPRAEHVELDHLDPLAHRGLEALQGVARPDRVGALVADALQRARGYLHPVGYLSEATRRRIAAALLVVGVAVAVLALANIGPVSNPASEAERARY